MGDPHVARHFEERRRQTFTRALLDDLHTLERILANDAVERGIRRIGAEQEMFLVNPGMRPSGVAVEVLEAAKDPRLTTELARFNLEANLQPRVFEGDCLRRMHEELDEVVDLARRHAAPHQARVLLAGILPTLSRVDLGLENMTPNPRYQALNDAMVAERGGDFDVHIRGIDELRITHDNVMLESCNTSFQLHLQVEPPEFARMYNLAQAVSAPILAAAVNSPTLLRQRLWAETRVALFETSVDTRSIAHQETGYRPRVLFGDDWVHDSVLEIYRDNITHFRVVIVNDEPELNSSEQLARGQMPKLGALCLHSGTVYRWNRVCYGVQNDVPHLRIENRVLPSGPTVLDEMANAAFFFGLMVGLSERYDRIDSVMRFDHAKANFFQAARHGLDAQLRWVGGAGLPASQLITEHLLPDARRGLERMEVDRTDIDMYLGVLEARVRSEQTGARWVYDSIASMRTQKELGGEVVFRGLTEAMLEGQAKGTPVHEWPLAQVREDGESWRASFETVGQILSQTLFSVRADDIIDLAAHLMDWHQVRHVPVEDETGQLIGLVSHRALLRLYARGESTRDTPLIVRDVMCRDPVTASTETPTLEAMQRMREHRVSCLPVVSPKGRLVGLVTERDLMNISTRLLERFLTWSATP